MSDTRPVRVHRIEIMVIDHDGLGADDVCAVLENTRYPNRCIRPVTMRADTREVAWSDEHPLNQSATAVEVYEALFAPRESEEE